MRVGFELGSTHISISSLSLLLSSCDRRHRLLPTLLARSAAFFSPPQQFVPLSLPKIAAMAYEFPTSAASKAHRNPPPRRGQIKAKIIGGLFRSVVAIGTKTVGRGRKGEGEGGRSSASGSPATLSGYTSEASSDG
ncbi:hypothetical protein Taro_013028 [Colocasia esculenta]|uniref:Uncharacterized protein n=1 Tax=Colocasia esculenta TaxID=4460 RepID=A0A843UAS7_COLES|nr:hypothetical protein [Colocasia esculenta]